MARLEKRPNVQPRSNFQHDLRKFIRQKKRDSYSIILGGNFNESMDQPRSAMRELAVTCGLVDIWARHNPSIQFNTRHPGSKHIDYVLVTPDIVLSVTAFIYFPFKYRGQSNHRSIYVDFDTATLFDKIYNNEDSCRPTHFPALRTFERLANMPMQTICLLFLYN
jgi:hypothetical protein